jgi:hypothetical protein
MRKMVEPHPQVIEKAVEAMRMDDLCPFSMEQKVLRYL